VIRIEEREGGVVFSVRVTPRARQDDIAGEHDGALKVRVVAPPTEDRANEALRRLLAEGLNVPVSAVRIVAGQRSRTKRVAIAGVAKDRIEALPRGKVDYAGN
jgi:uncharacterized protein (TIGR00251 family)